MRACANRDEVKSIKKRLNANHRTKKDNNEPEFLEKVLWIKNPQISKNSTN